MFSELFKFKAASPESAEKREKIPTPVIRLEFFRHSKQGPQTAGMQEYQRRLTDEGRQMATEAGKDRNPEPEMAIAYGSPRDRSQETAYRQMFSGNTEVTSESSLEDIEELVSGQLAVGQKKIIDERLNFNWDGSKNFNEVGMDHFLNKKDTLRFLVEESDNLAVESGDKVSTCYTRAAANTAEIIGKYLKVLPNWVKVAEKDADRPTDESKGYAAKNNELQRFLGSHGATVENFLLKVIEKSSGREGALEFIKSLPDQNNFQFNDGYSVTLSEKDGRAEIVIKYHDRVWNIDPRMIEEIIKERETLDKRIGEGQA